MAKAPDKSKVRPYSFSMETPLYKKFMSMCRERGINASALIRRMMMIQMRDWATGDLKPLRDLEEGE